MEAADERLLTAFFFGDFFFARGFAAVGNKVAPLLSLRGLAGFPDGDFLVTFAFLATVPDGRFFAGDIFFGAILCLYSISD